MCPRNTPGEALIHPALLCCAHSLPWIPTREERGGRRGPHCTWEMLHSRVQLCLICRWFSEISEFCSSRAIPWQRQLPLAGSVPGAGRAEGDALPWAQLALGVGCDRGHVCHLVTVSGAWDSEEALPWVSFT